VSRDRRAAVPHAAGHHFARCWSASPLPPAAASWMGPPRAEEPSG